MGFNDADLTTPLHDEIMLWFDAGLRSGELIDRVREQIWRDQAAYALRHWNEKSLMSSIPILQGTATCDITRWERPVIAGTNNFIVGYIDLWVRMTGSCPTILDERWIVTDNRSIECAFEVKSRIPSLGEVIRQMRTYQQHALTSRMLENYWFIVCPDDRFAAPLKEQGIHFLKYER